MEKAFRTLVRTLTDVPVSFGILASGTDAPAVVLNTISDTEDHHMRGPDGLSRARIQLDVYAPTYGAAKTLSESLRRGLNGHRGGIFQGVFLDGVRDRYDTGDTTPLHRVSLDFRILYQR
ncbi:tail completion protein gp17 [Falsirhodobacter halotolerans]|uniref:tail completion protein gp17 n=1 Tax=Falsirhodobacter halotolerans TaxID=1146892 RepID=UPI001FD04E10|nr:DUF3168 domain-containing protein [Falsirhodobacter halotolerans]MCJ8139513.1 DUF3168 domain-containing protein [Falsirhodobacter halotolerans]